MALRHACSTSYSCVRSSVRRTIMPCDDMICCLPFLYVTSRSACTNDAWLDRARCAVRAGPMQFIFETCASTKPRNLFPATPPCPPRPGPGPGNGKQSSGGGPHQHHSPPPRVFRNPHPGRVGAVRRKSSRVGCRCRCQPYSRRGRPPGAHREKTRARVPRQAVQGSSPTGVRSPPLGSDRHPPRWHPEGIHTVPIPILRARPRPPARAG